jgi:beta-xylosidase
MRNAWLVTLMAVVGSAATALAEEATSQPPPGAVRPILDVPIRHPSVARGPDGTFYLTGTGASSRAGGGLDFDNNPSVRLWQSRDLKQWDDAGRVWDLVECADRSSRWQRGYKILPNTPDSPRVRGITAPEIHYAKNTFWITYSISGQGTGLLRSSSAKAEGPYQDLGQMTAFGGDASLFEDDDGAVYWVFGPGWIARMKDDLSGLAERPRLMQPDGKDSPVHAPPMVGSGGAFLFKHAGKYHLACADYFGRLGGTACHDTFVATADHVYGPYRNRRLMIPHGGQTTVFQDTAGQWYGTFSGNDPFAVLRDRPGLVPLAMDAATGHIVKQPGVITERGPVGRLAPMMDTFLRDPHILLAPDGRYYLTGTTRKKDLRCPAIRLWKSSDLQRWEPLGDAHGVVWYCDQADWTKEAQVCRFNPRLGKMHDVWAPEIHFVRGNYYVTFSMSFGGCGLLRSTSGKPEGPYESLGRLEDKWIDSSLFQDDDGAVYFLFQCTWLAKMKPDMSGLAAPPVHIGPAGRTTLGYEGSYLVKAHGKYVLFGSDWNGEDPFGPAGRADGTYDLMYCCADHILGPYSQPRLAVPHGGHGSLFQDKQRTWYATLFGSDGTAPFREKPAMVRLRIERRGDDILVEPVD